MQNRCLRNVVYGEAFTLSSPTNASQRGLVIRIDFGENTA